MEVRTKHLAHHLDSLEQRHEVDTLAMWIFLATELLVFGVLFTGYTVYRLQEPRAYEAGSRHLNLLIGGLNTVVLLTSSLTMALAVHAARADRQRMLVTCLILTALLGTAFMGLKAVEYYSDYRDNLVPGSDHFKPEEWTAQGVDPQRLKLFLLFYYIMTGLHAVHLMIGIGVLVWIILLAWKGRFWPDHYSPVEVFGLYWHFVDIVWIFLLPLLYLIGTHSPADLHF